jgi:hypothetical protein
MKSVDELVRIAHAGGGMVIPPGKSTDELVRIAHAAAGKGATILIRGARSKNTDECVRIAHAGKGAVQFDFEEQ